MESPPGTIVPDNVLSRLITARPANYPSPEVLDDMERLFGHFEPTKGLLRQTIEAVFWASLSEEEGKPAITRVLFADTRDRDCRLDPREVSPAELRKLSPILDVSSNALLIRKDAKIVGVGQWQDHDFGIVAHRPGRLAVLDGSVVLGVFELGEWVIVGGSSVNVVTILQRAVPDNKFQDRFLKASLVLSLAMKARRAGRGATFVIVPGDCVDNGIGSPSYPIGEFTAMQMALEGWRRANAATPKPEEQDPNRRLVNRALAIAAAGAGIDGATVIDDSSLGLIGFGAKINADDKDFEIKLLKLPDTNVQVIKKEDTGGMRHQSAARLVYKNHNATVITVSQDGPVSLFAWDNNDASVVMIKHLDRYLESETVFDR